MTDLRTSITQAFEYLTTNSIEIPPDIRMLAHLKGVPVKAGQAAGDLSSINRVYHDAITKILTAYFENGGSVASPRGQFKQAVSVAFLDAFELGWTDGGQDLPVDADAMDWLAARQEQEFGFIDMLFQQAKELRKDTEFDYFSWITERADGYTNTLKEIYNAAHLRAVPDQMVTFEGDDGQESCDTCQKLKGKRHKVSWFVARNYVPPFGSGLDCAKGGHCQHGLMNDNGDWITV